MYTDELANIRSIFIYCKLCMKCVYVLKLTPCLLFLLCLDFMEVEVHGEPKYSKIKLNLFSFNKNYNK